MQNNFQKFMFVGIIVAVALFSRVAYPTFYAIGNGSDGNHGAAPAGAASAQVPFFVLQTASSTTSSPQAAPQAAALALPQSAVVAQALPDAGPPTGPSAGPSAPAINDHASLIADLETGEVKYGTNEDSRWPLASLTKLMTATVVLDQLSLDARVTVTPAAVSADPQQTILQAGDVYTVGDLLHVLLLPSSNVAAEALAAAQGSRAAFLAAMNARAAAWGMASTHYDDPSGLSAGNQSTADDLLLLAQKIYANYPQILAITRTPQVTITELGSGRQTVVKSINDFAGRADFVGGKTGYTDEAAGNLLSIFNYGGRPLLIVVLGTEDGVRFAKTLQLYNWYIRANS